MNDILTKGKTTLVIMCGAPASGKSTWAKDFVSKFNVVYVSTDGIRAEIGNGEGDQSVSYAAFMLAEKRIREALSQGKDSLIDATNVNPKSRKNWIKIARSADARIVAVAFEVPTEELYKRNQLRERHVPDNIIESFVNKYIRPTTSEVDRVILIKQ